jgi:hypothetical protein
MHIALSGLKAKNMPRLKGGKELKQDIKFLFLYSLLYSDKGFCLNYIN